MKLLELLNNVRIDNPNAVAREDDEGVYFDLKGDEYPEDVILDVSHSLTLL